jgi:hypothetical protein
MCTSTTNWRVLPDDLPHTCHRCHVTQLLLSFPGLTVPLDANTSCQSPSRRGDTGDVAGSVSMLGLAVVASADLDTSTLAVAGPYCCCCCKRSKASNTRAFSCIHSRGCVIHTTPDWTWSSYTSHDIPHLLAAWEHC